MGVVDFYSKSKQDSVNPVYVVVGARYHGKWVFVKSRKRGTYEMPAGHINPGESADNAAGRELAEETGAMKFVLECIGLYSVTRVGDIMWGILYYADILELGDVQDMEEIEEVIFRDELPDEITFPEVQSALFERAATF